MNNETNFLDLQLKVMSLINSWSKVRIIEGFASGREGYISEVEVLEDGVFVTIPIDNYCSIITMGSNIEKAN